MHRVIILAIALSLSTSSFSFAEEKDQTVAGFSLVQYEDGGAKKWELKGKKAQMHVRIAETIVTRDKAIHQRIHRRVSSKSDKQT